MTTFGELKCEVCGVPGSQTPMYRANPKGETGRWRCESCLDTPPDAGVLAVTDQFVADNMRQELEPDTPMTPELEAWVRSQRNPESTTPHGHS